MAETTSPATESDVYSAVLKYVTWTGFILLVVFFALYVFQVLPVSIPFERLSSMWRMSAAEANATFQRPTGWDWVNRLGQGDVICHLAIAVLCAASLLAALATVPVMIRRKNRLYAFILLLVVGVISLAASGLLTGPH